LLHYSTGKKTKNAQNTELSHNLSKKQTNQIWLPKRLIKLKRKTKELVIALLAGKNPSFQQKFGTLKITTN
jgi:hypothetical protein